jgi:cytochrome c oxidase cbb3-type subunit 1
VEADLKQSGIQTSAGVDASSKSWVLFLWLSGAGWLCIGGLLALLSDIKLVHPDFISGCSWMTYGKTVPASQLAITYGFISQFLLGAAVYVIARLSGSAPQNSLLGLFGTVFWNIGVTLGVIGIFLGHTTGQLGMEAPRYASSVLFIAFLIMAVWALMPIWTSKNDKIYASTWYLLAAMLCFTWVFFGGYYVIGWIQPEGILGSVIAKWGSTNLLQLWVVLGSIGLIYYITPKITGSSPTSASLAALGFWTFLVFSSGAGVSELRGGPFPQWLTALGVVFKSFMIIPMLCIALSLKSSFKGEVSAENRIPYLLSALSAVSLISWMALSWASSCEYFARYLSLTWFQQGLNDLAIFGVAGSATLAVIFYSLPRLLGRSFCCSGFHWIAFISQLAGVVLFTAPSILGGVIQGLWLAQVDLDVNAVLTHLDWVYMIRGLGILMIIGSASYAVFIIKWSFCQSMRRGFELIKNPVKQQQIESPANQAQEGVA